MFADVGVIYLVFVTILENTIQCSPLFLCMVMCGDVFGTDNVIDDDTAGLDSLQLENDIDAGTDLMLSSTDKNDMDDLDSPDTEAFQLKADYNDIWSRYRELSESLKHS